MAEHERVASEERAAPEAPAALALAPATAIGRVLALQRIAGNRAARLMIVLLAAMTRREETQIETFAADPDRRWEALGHAAQERWAPWLDSARDSLRWDADGGAFTA
jgi:hypothetical protein